jgi:hypothetical protein
MQLQRTLVLGIVAVATTGLLAPPGAAATHAGAPTAPPSAPTSFTTPGELSGLAATSRHDIWAVGSSRSSGPLVLHRGRGAWSAVPVADPATGGLNGVAATSKTNAWAVGTGGALGSSTALVLHWDGLSWTPQFDAIDGRLADVAAVSAQLAWAVGSTTKGRDLILQWDGTTWQRLAVRFRGELLAVAARSAHDAWAVGLGRGLRAQVLHLHGHTWTRVPVRVPATGGLEKVLLGVALASHGRVWAVGDVSCGCGPGPSLVLHRALGHWSRVHSPSPRGGTVLTGVTSAAGRRATWSVGASGSGDGPTHTIILKRTRHGWKHVPAPSPGSSPSLAAVTAISPSNVWAVGQFGCRTNHCRTLIEHWNGHRWH